MSNFDFSAELKLLLIIPYELLRHTLMSNYKEPMIEV